MVPSFVATSPAKDRLLDLSVRAALDQGIVDLSLREIAAAVGTSHRMLIYHFGSREGLLTSVVRDVERRQREVFTEETISIIGAQALWERLADPSLRSQERLFFEIYSHALLHRPGTEGFLEEAIESWIEPVADSLTSLGLDHNDARDLARLGLALSRGLLLDLLATEDIAGTTRAFELFARLCEPSRLLPGSGSA